MQRKAIALLLTSTLAVFSSSRALGSALGPDDVAAMMHAMLSMVRIWNAMNGTTPWDASRTWAAAPPHVTAYQPSAPWGGNGLCALGNLGRNGYPFAQPVHRLARQLAAARAAAMHRQVAMDLSGAWQGASGDILVVRGNRFRIHNAEGHYRDGTFQIAGDQFWTYVPASGVTRRYQLAHRGNWLALQDAEGQVLHFKRLEQSFPWRQKQIIM